MKNTSMNRKITVSVIGMMLLVLGISGILLTSLFLVGCGETDNDTKAEVVVNNQPSIGAIPDQTVDAGAETTVAVNVTDADADDTYTIRASSNDKAIATVSVKNTTLTINGVAGGLATITVSAIDDSGQDNAAAVPVIFTLTVNEMTYDPGKNIETLPTDFWVPQRISGASFQVKRGEGAIIEFRKGGLIENDGVTYTCVSDGGCRIEGTLVTKGTIQVTK